MIPTALSGPLSGATLLGERWPSRLVATAEENRLNFLTAQSVHVFAAASDCLAIAIYSTRLIPKLADPAFRSLVLAIETMG